MKILLVVSALLVATAARAEASRQTYPSCDLAAQHALKGTPGGSVKDVGQAHISKRADILQADIGSARKARQLGQGQAQELWQRVQAIRSHAGAFVTEQSFLSAAERATYDRQLDAIAEPICHPARGGEGR